jgi:phosphate transport system substrate-binding protein
MNGLSHLWARSARFLVLATILAGLIGGGCQGVSGPLVGLGEEVAEVTDEPALVRVAACWASLPLVSELVAEYGRLSPRTSFDVVPVGSAVAQDLLATGQADVAVVGVDPATPADEGGGPGAEVLALDAVAVVVHPSVGIHTLSAGQLAALYAGEYLRWDELGGADEAVEVLVHTPESLGRAVFERVIMGDTAVSSFAIIVPHDRAVIEYVAEHPGAIGYVSNAYVDDRVRVVAIDEHRPTAAEIRSGRYPLGYPLVFLTTPDAPREAQRWINHARGNRGRHVIERRYSLPG